MIVFRYKEEAVGNSSIVKRPIADVYLRTISNVWIEFHPYIDSGADLTMIPLSLGKLLGFSLDKKKVQKIGGISGSIPVINTSCVIRIEEQEFSVSVAWALIEDIPPLLGRKDIFDNFDILFKQKDGLVIFKKHID